jgi:hypothetical protein
VIFFALLVGFIVYITVKGQLTGYLAVIGLEGVASSTGSSTGLPRRTGGISPPGTVTVSV